MCLILVQRSINIWAKANLPLCRDEGFPLKVCIDSFIFFNSFLTAAVALICRLKGFSVLAHPWCCKDPAALIRSLSTVGLQGLEVFTGNETLKTEFTRLAQECNLHLLGGSDFHGRESDFENRLGNLPIPDDVGEWMLKCATDGHWPLKNGATQN